jgi:hypothetical protein
MKKRHNVLGFKLRESVPVTLDLLKQSEAMCAERTVPGWRNQYFTRLLQLDDTVVYVVLEHLGYGPIEGLEAKLHTGVDRALEYFFGDWWKGDEADARAVDKSRKDRELQWFGALSHGMFLGGLTGRWDDVARMCSWIDESVEADFHGGLVEDGYMQMILGIASSLRPEPLKGFDLMLGFVKSARTKRAKLLCSLWEAAQSRDQAAFDKSLKEAVAYFLKADARDVANVNFWVALHPSFVWLIAERNGLRFPDLPERLEAAVVRRQTIGLA